MDRLLLQLLPLLLPPLPLLPSLSLVLAQECPRDLMLGPKQRILDGVFDMYRNDSIVDESYNLSVHTTSKRSFLYPGEGFLGVSVAVGADTMFFAMGDSCSPGDGHWWEVVAKLEWIKERQDFWVSIHLGDYVWHCETDYDIERGFPEFSITGHGSSWWTLNLTEEGCARKISINASNTLNCTQYPTTPTASDIPTCDATPTADDCLPGNVVVLIVVSVLTAVIYVAVMLRTGVMEFLQLLRRKQATSFSLVDERTHSASQTPAAVPQIPRRPPKQLHRKLTKEQTSMSFALIHDSADNVNPNEGDVHEEFYDAPYASTGGFKEFGGFDETDTRGHSDEKDFHFYEDPDKYRADGDYDELRNLQAYGEYKAGTPQGHGEYDDVHSLQRYQDYDDVSTLQGHREYQEADNDQGYQEYDEVNSLQGYRESQKAEYPEGYGEYDDVNNVQAYGEFEKTENPQAYGQYEAAENPQAYGRYEETENPQAYRQYEETENPQAYRQYEETENPQAYRQYEETENPQAYRQYEETENPQAYRQYEETENPQAYGDYEEIKNPQAYRQYEEVGALQAYGDSEEDDNDITYEDDVYLSPRHRHM